MSDTTNYELEVIGSQDPEYIIFKLLKDVPDAKSYFDENGKSTHNGYDWRELEDEMRQFSKSQPGVTFYIVERGSYDGNSFEYRHYFKDGRYAYIEPRIKIEWPPFSEDLLA